jgi:hypothetical protein
MSHTDSALGSLRCWNGNLRACFVHDDRSSLLSGDGSLHLNHFSGTTACSRLLGSAPAVAVSSWGSSATNTCVLFVLPVPTANV